MSGNHATVPVFNNVEKWIKDNEKEFLPPVCNKMMHNTQLKVFYVGGPNQRKDYHLEEGEEFFYMKKGDMCLKIQEGGKFKDVHIKEGQVFLLPGKIPHSPQRNSETMGMVIERERLLSETDGLRYFVEGSTDILFEKWFYCDDLGKQLVPIIKGFFASEQYKTGKPIPEEITTDPPWIPDSERVTEDPFDLETWIEKNFHRIQKLGKVELFDLNKYQSEIIVFGKNAGYVTTDGGEMMLWQLRGASIVDIPDPGMGSNKLAPGDTLLVPECLNFQFKGDENCVCLSIMMDIRNKQRIKC